MCELTKDAVAQDKQTVGGSDEGLTSSGLHGETVDRVESLSLGRHVGMTIPVGQQPTAGQGDHSDG